MACHLYALTFDADQPLRLARFWSGLLGWEITDDPSDGIVLPPADDTGFRLRFRPARGPKVGQNQAHFDLTSTSQANQEQTVARALELGGRHLDVGQDPTDGHVVLADPEGNEFCVIEPGNNFLADCGLIGALACDGSQQVGYFWSAALDWPLVWDQDQETAIRSPHGGPKITWGGPPVPPKTGRNRLHFDLVPSGDDDQQAVVDRLLSLGATRLDEHNPADDGRPAPAGGAVVVRGDLDGSATGPVELADPDGNEFCVLASR
ncbi:VOC family protein [Solwaraspora sp. WMMD1047]|uniref:VOC family protein n=1 Tax=Solwaraspora sp. WMMD1047 TaxID=3016102 RepID=UPI0024164557|nr:VOC family protein [Solwaraspora sp. WMMD1047]MDG4830423.1 VOC family protein [Solwaraspora sp. WMMD1047]